MLQVIEQTREEKIAMYMKLKKREIAEMLANANDAIDMLQKSRSSIWTSWAGLVCL